MKMTITQLRYFVKATELHSITATADFFCVSQPAVSNAIHDLEKEYDIILFTREGRKIHLTEQGRVFLDTARSLVQHFDKADDIFKNYNEGQPTYRIALTSSYSYLYLADLYLYLQKNMPSVRFAFDNILISQMLQGLENETLDIACLSVFGDGLKDLIVHDSIQYTLKFCISEKMYNADQEEISLEEIAKMPLAIHQKGSSHNKSVRKCFEEAGIEPDIQFELNQLGAIRQLVRKGLTGTILSADVFKDDPTVRSYRIDHPDFSYPIRIIHKKNNPQIQEIVKLILKFFKEQET